MLIVGLGNPGKHYETTRHNIGFIAVEALSRRYNFSWGTRSKFNGEMAEGTIFDTKVFLLKPDTFMNLSGNAVKAVSSYYRISAEEIYVIHDDLDLKLGTIKIKQGGSSGGHNGLKSIDMHVGNNYHRIRIGIGRPLEEEAADYVLGSITKGEWPFLERSIDRICENFDLVIKQKLEEFKTLVQVK